MSQHLVADRLAVDLPALPDDYAERVYAGVLGKIIGVYLGRPFEGWRHRRIMDELGEIRYYVNDRVDLPLKNHRLVVTDDDITGTFVFPRVLRDYPVASFDAVHVGRTWLNYIIEQRTVLWWGGRGNSTEHTAFLLLKDGVEPPESGSIARNGKVVAEQVGAQIFAEGWGLVSPGDPERAAAMAVQSARVSHDGEALQAARVVAALVAQAFVEPDVQRLFDTATELVASDCLIRRVIDDVRQWHADGLSWERGFARIDERYGYERYGGNCHVVPNHAVVVHSLLHGGGDFSRALSVVNSCGWDTDSNAGNVGCVAGVLAGLRGIDAGPDWRGPIADRMYLPSADGGGTVTDAAREAVAVVGYTRALRGEPAFAPKNGARFHFDLPGAVQGFTAIPAGAMELANVSGHSEPGSRSLALRYHATVGPAYALTPTFLTPDTVQIPPYGMVACPTLYSGQRLRARVSTDGNAVDCALVVRVFNGEDRTVVAAGPATRIEPDDASELTWTVPDTFGHPIADVGIVLNPTAPRDGTAHLDYLTWEGEPSVTLTRPADGGSMWRHAWTDAVDSFDQRWPEAFRIVQNHGRGLLIHGTREWRDYTVSADVTPHLAEGVGLAARVQGLRRYYALRLIRGGVMQLIRMLDAHEVLAERPFQWEFGRTYQLTLTVVGHRLIGVVDDVVLEAVDDDGALESGGVALLIEEGRTATNVVRVRPAAAPRETSTPSVSETTKPAVSGASPLPQEGTHQ